MDNLTHSLIGVTLGRALLRKSKSKTEAAWRSCAVVTAVVASNIPDGDFLFFLNRSNEKLGYLIHHRGFTHTIFVSILVSVVLALALSAMYKLNKKQRLQNIGLAIIAGLLHITADSWNDYGVHPFWPLSNNWYYGDSIFIVEPLLIFSMLPLAYFSAESVWGKRIWVAAGAGILLLAWISAFSQWWVALWISCVAGAFYLWQKRKPQGLLPAVTGVLATLLLFFTAGSLARKEIRSVLSPGGKKDSEIRQLMTSPAPSNPLCWRTLVATVDRYQNYAGHIGFVSLAPKLIQPLECFEQLIGKQSAPLRPPLVASTDKVFWYADFQAPAKEFIRLENENCTVDAVSRFLRIPFWKDAGENVVIGDLRYDREKRRGFAEIEVSKKDKNCLIGVPPWNRPIQLD
ncbi:metal-dependent hydrolase [bacterium]|nr:metal-dependent hydrolase [bacterium]